MYLYILHLYAFHALLICYVPTQWSIGYGQMERAVLFVSVVQVRDAYSSSSSSFA